MKKRIISCLLALTMVCGLFVGCGKPAEEAPAEDAAVKEEAEVEAPAEEEATEEATEEGGTVNVITAWAIPQVVLDKFTEETGIEVKQDVYTTDYTTVRDARMATGEPLDIVGMDQAAAREFSQKGYLVDITDEALWNNVKDNAVADITNFFGGSRYGVCYECSALGVWYNKDIFAEYNIEVPTSFEEFIAVCDTLVENGVTPLVQGGKDVWPLDQHLRLAMNQLTETYPNFQDDIVAGTLKWNDPEVVAVIEERIAHLQNEDYFAGGLLSTTYDQCWQLMLQEEAAMWVMGNFAVEVIAKSDVQPEFEVGAFAAPNNAEGTQQVMVGDTFTEIYGVLETSENKENAIKLLEFLTREDIASMWANEAMSISTIKGAAADSLPAGADWDTITELPVSGTYTFYDEVNAIMDPLLTDIVIGDMTVQEYCDQMAAAQEIDSAALAQ